MGGCAGKNKSTSTKKSKAPSADNSSQTILNTSSKKDLLSSNDVNDNNHMSNIRTNGIEPIIDKQNEISQNFPPRVISISDSEFEIELANLVYGHPEIDYAENRLMTTTYKSTEV
ncbi:unnamed protein product [Adineta steineri]|uniref:Uncharacterized protein n=1 Tax=Adineta steineri TaxID=433720 RepID=A0A819KF92_9BILA|nr:unnamed protein product [Adineta steineri]CAF3948104.1 unnamed protein product [Adineta steineri]